MIQNIPDFSRARILIVGDLMLDRYWTGPSSRISPEAPVPVVAIHDCEERAGGAGNVALNIASLGGHVLLDGHVGDDEQGKTLTLQLQHGGVDCRFTPLDSLQTITKLRVVSRNQQLIRLDFEDEKPVHGKSPALLERFARHLDEVDAVLLSDYAKGTLEQAPDMIALARKAGKPVLIDPKGRDFEKYRGATLLTPNAGEFEAIVGPCHSDEELSEKGEKLRDELELEALLVTRGERGMSLLRAGHPAMHIATRAREVYDVTGAGDTVIAVLTAALAAGESLDQATVLANLAAGIVIAKQGAVAISREELQAAVSAHIAPTISTTTPILGHEALTDMVQRCHAMGETVVMTNGCFDIIHAGHIRYLQQARALGDRLIIAVNDDASVGRLKGPTRPIVPLQQRMEILAALKGVDWITPFSENTPEQLICQLKPDILVKGGDYQVSDIAGHRCILDNGGEVIILDYEEGCSTTGIIEKITETG